MSGSEFSLDQLVLPPPIVSTVEAIDQNNQNVPGEIVISKQGQLLKKFLTYEGFTGDLIDTYNNFVVNRMPAQIAARPLNLPDGRTIQFTRLHQEKPSTSKQATDPRMLPITARNRGLTYSASLYVDAVLKQGDLEIERIEKVHVGRVPVMLGSTLCYLAGKTEQEKMELGECAKDPLGYFIINGGERVVILQEKLRANQIQVITKDAKGTLVCKITCNTIHGSSVVTLSRSNKGGIRLQLKFLGSKNTISVFQAFRLFGFTNPNDMFQLVLVFTRPEWVKRVWFELQQTYIELISVADDIENISALRSSTKLPYEARKEAVLGFLNDELFPHMNGEPIINKIYMLGMMTARYVEVLLGLRPIDDRDNWGNKRLESAGRSMEQLFGRLWDKMITDAETTLAKQKRQNPSLRTVINSIRSDIITSEFVSSFNSNNWGVKGSKVKENITDSIKRSSLMELQSQLMKINTPTNRQVKQPRVRQVQMSQIGYVDAIETPEGSNCGLVKAKAVGCYLSIERDETPIRQYISPYVSPQPTENYRSPCLINGKFLGWCPGEAIRDYLISLRRSSSIYKDTAIIIESDKALYIYTDGARPTRPLLIVDTDGELVIKKKNLFGASFDELLREGAVEYIDAKEQESLMLAQSIHDLDYRATELREALSRRDEAVSKLNELRSLAGPLEGLTPQSRSRLLELLGQESHLTNGRLTELYQSTLGAVQQEVNFANDTVNRLTSRRPYTHCELDPNALFGIAASIIPLPDHNQAPRNVYQCNMSKQSLGINHSNHQLRFDTTTKMLAFPTRPIMETQMYNWVGLDQLPAGDTVICAIMTYTGYNQEDAIIFNKSSIDRGLFRMVVYRKYSTVQKQSSHEYTELITRPSLRKTDPPNLYQHLDDNGIARIGSKLKSGDVVIGKTRTDRKTGQVDVVNVRLGVGEEGVVDEILETVNAQGERLVKVKIRQVRLPIVGDKFASRYAQKSTIGLILPAEDMPFTQSGLVPDVIINPHSIPSRMTIGKLFEIVSSKIGALTGERVNATPFNNFDIDQFKRMLVQYGYNQHGNERMFSGLTGKPLQAEIFIGPCYYQALRHHILDKEQARAKGDVSAITRAPVGGRKRKGGLRYGEMERDNLISHGASATLVERLCTSSDAYKTVFCKTCGTIAISDILNKTFVCRRCSSRAEFGTCTIPYTFKLLSHMLAGAGFNVQLGMKKL